MRKQDFRDCQWAVLLVDEICKEMGNSQHKSWLFFTSNWIVGDIRRCYIISSREVRNFFESNGSSQEGERLKTVLKRWNDEYVADPVASVETAAPSAEQLAVIEEFKKKGWV